MKNDAVTEYCRGCSGLEVRDIFKFLYQSCFGCEHLVSDSKKVLKKIKEEMPGAQLDDLPEIEMLDGDFCRVHLKTLKESNAEEALARLFIQSAVKQNDGEERLMNELIKLKLSAKEGSIPFSEEEIDRAILKWRDEGFGPVHHSETFRKMHHPAYRVIRKELLEKLI